MVEIGQTRADGITVLRDPATGTVRIVQDKTTILVVGFDSLERLISKLSEVHAALLKNRIQRPL